MREFESISEAFRILRDEHGLSQRDLAWMVGVSRVTVINIESGKTECCSHVILRLMDIFEFKVKVDTDVMRDKLKALTERNRNMKEARAAGLTSKGFYKGFFK